ncbi:hypothetical protein M0811_11249 [Anaeramoeba ignava]|uniref:Uncharacterized protein n=1 Tax=Anaeramoeba ignava TaxID=1746090 RepID=A0A9Q0LCR6_ANAIG|nr:hypothetical protein M0811_11249 [Anaeramoeba ignava]
MIYLVNFIKSLKEILKIETVLKKWLKDYLNKIVLLLSFNILVFIFFFTIKKTNFGFYHQFFIFLSTRFLIPIIFILWELTSFKIENFHLPKNIKIRRKTLSISKNPLFYIFFFFFLISFLFILVLLSISSQYLITSIFPSQSFFANEFNSKELIKGYGIFIIVILISLIYYSEEYILIKNIYQPLEKLELFDLISKKELSKKGFQAPLATLLTALISSIYQIPFIYSQMGGIYGNRINYFFKWIGMEFFIQIMKKIMKMKNENENENENEIQNEIDNDSNTRKRNQNNENNLENSDSNSNSNNKTISFSFSNKILNEKFIVIFTLISITLFWILIFKTNQIKPEIEIDIWEKPDDKEIGGCYSKNIMKIENDKLFFINCEGFANFTIIEDYPEYKETSYNYSNPFDLEHISIENRIIGECRIPFIPGYQKEVITYIHPKIFERAISRNEKRCIINQINQENENENLNKYPNCIPHKSIQNKKIEEYEIKPNIVFLLFDAASTPIYEKSLTKTISTIEELENKKKKIKSFSFPGYRIVGLNSYINQHPMYCGKKQEIMESPYSDSFLWNIFTKKGYFTTFIDEICFGYYQWMWRVEPEMSLDACPFDYRFYRPFCGSNWNPFENDHAHCLYGNYGYQYNLNATYDLLNNPKYIEIPKFIISNFYESHESTQKVFKTVDKDVSSFLKNIYSKSIGDYTIIVILSDHGPHYGYYKQFYHKYPLFNIIFPNKFFEKFPNLKTILKRNEHNIFSAYDIYSSFVHLINNFESYDKKTTHQSLFDPEMIPNRSCEEVCLLENFNEEDHNYYCENWFR